MTAIEPIAPAIAMIAAFALVFGGIRMMRHREKRTKGVLMLVMAAVLIANVAIWTM